MNINTGPVFPSNNDLKKNKKTSGKSKEPQNKTAEASASDILAVYSKAQINSTQKTKNNNSEFSKMSFNQKKEFLFDKLLTAKNEKGYPIFDKYCIYVLENALTEDNIDFIADVALKKDNGKYRYSDDDVCKIVDYYRAKGLEQTQKILNFIDTGDYKKDVVLTAIKQPDVVKEEDLPKLEKFAEFKIKPKELELLTSQLHDKQKYQRAIELIEKKISAYNVDSLTSLDDIRYERCLNLIDKNVDEYFIYGIAALDDDKYEESLDLLNKGTDAAFIADIVNLPEEQRMKYDELYDLGIEPFYSLNLTNTAADKQIKKFTYLFLRGIDPFLVQDLAEIDDKQYDMIVKLLENGTDIIDAKEISNDENEFNKEMKKINSIPNKMRDFLNSEDCLEKIQKASEGKYQKELVSVLAPENLTFEARKHLLNSGLSEQDYLNSIKKLAKSVFKLAMSTPNQYLSGIDIKYTTKQNGKYIKLPEDVLLKQQKKVCDFFKDNACKIARALKYLDTDTINQMMDKRTDLFEDSLDKLDLLSDENYMLLSDLTKGKSALTGKDLTARDKIQLCEIVKIYQEANIDNSLLYEMAKSGNIDIPKAKSIITKEIILNVGVNEKDLDSIPKDKIKFNEEYSYLALQNSDKMFDGVMGERIKDEFRNEIQRIRRKSQYEREIYVNNLQLRYGKNPNKAICPILERLTYMCKNIDKYSDNELLDVFIEEAKLYNKLYKTSQELYTVISNSILNDFNKFISDLDNIYGQTNAKTKKDFQSLGLNYDKWLNPNLDDVNMNINGKPLKIKLWERNPQEDLFLGNKTTCCTAIGTGGNAAATPLYLLSTAFNVVELYDENNNTVGMSRVFMSNVDNKPSLIMDNIELNKTYFKNMPDRELTEVRNGFFKYMNEYVKQVTGNKDSSVYFYAGDIHVPTKDLTRKNAPMDFIGNIAQESVYFNSTGLDWINTENIKNIGEIDWLVVPKNITS